MRISSWLGAWLLGAALSIAPPAPLEARDRGVDGEFTKRSSPHFVVFQDVDIDHYSGKDGIRNFERQVLNTLEDAYQAVASTLSLRPNGKIPVEIYDPDVFDRRFNKHFNFKAVGFYHDGGIRVRGATKVEANLVATLHHEYVHAVIDSAAPGHIFPSWLNEGLAEYFEHMVAGRKRIHGGEAKYLHDAIQRGGWLPLDSLQSFDHVNQNNATLAYVEAYAMVEHLVRKHGEDKLRTFIREFIRSRNLERAVQRKYRMTLAELEAEVIKEYR